MKTNLMNRLLIVLVLLLGTISYVQAAPAKYNLTVRVVLEDKTTVPGVGVVVDNISKYTNEDGIAVFAGLQDGATYIIKVSTVNGVIERTITISGGDITIEIEIPEVVIEPFNLFTRGKGRYNFSQEPFLMAILSGIQKRIC